MPVPVALALGAAGVVSSLFHRRKKMPLPTGYITPADRAEAEKLRQRRGVTAGRLAEEGRAGALRRYATRGVSASPAVERTMGRINEAEGGMLQQGNLEADSFLEDIRRGREGFQQNLYLRDYERNHAREATFWNSISNYLPMLAGYFPGAGGEGGGVMGDPGWEYPMVDPNKAINPGRGVPLNR